MCVTGNHDQAGRHSCHAIPGRHSGQGRRCTLAASVPGWTVIQVYGVIKAGDLATFQRYTENVDPAATLVIVTGPGGNLSAGIGMGIRVHQKKLIVGAKGMCASSCALIWMGGETGRKFIYRTDQGTGLCFHQASHPTLRAPLVTCCRPPSGSGNALISKYLADLGYNQDMIEWATIADPQHRLCLNPELAEEISYRFLVQYRRRPALYPAGEPRIASSGATGATPIPRRRRHPPQPEPSQRVEPEFASSGATGVTPIPRRAHTASSTANLRCLVLVRAHPKMGYRRLGFDQ